MLELCVDMYLYNAHNLNLIFHSTQAFAQQSAQLMQQIRMMNSNFIIIIQSLKYSYVGHADYRSCVIMCMCVLGSIWSIEDSESNNSNTAGVFNSSNNMERGGSYSEWRHNRKPSLPLYLNAPTPYIILKNLSPQVCMYS